MKYQFAVFSFVLSFFLTPLAHSQPLKVCATVPELGSLAREIGGDQVTVTVFAKGTEDPHFVVPKPSFIKALNACQAYVQIGLDLEAGWAPDLLNNARNAAILPGGRGHINAATAITPLEVTTATISDRSMGDVHATGNPHFLLSPINGLRVAQLLRDRFSALQAKSSQYFLQRYDNFRQRLGIALVGETLSNTYDFEKLAILAQRGRLGQFLKSQGKESVLGGWFKTMQPHYGTKVVADHTMWPYFAQAFGLSLIGHLEPLPGLQPTTSHLTTVIEIMKTHAVKVVLASAYYNPRYADFVAEHTGATVVHMAHQGESRPGTENYLDMIDYNVTQLSAVLGGPA